MAVRDYERELSGGSESDDDTERRQSEQFWRDEEEAKKAALAAARAQQNTGIARAGMAAMGGGLGFATLGPLGIPLGASGGAAIHDFFTKRSSGSPSTARPSSPSTTKEGGRFNAGTDFAQAPAPAPAAPKPTIDWRTLIMPKPGLMQGDVSQPLPAVNIAPPPAPAPMPQMTAPTMDFSLSPEMIQANTILANRAKAGATVPSMQPAIDMAHGAAMGTAPSAAQEMMKAQSDRLMAQQMGAAYARGGYNPGAVRGAQQAGAMAQQGSLADMAALRANEQAAGRTLFANTLGQQGQFSLMGQDLSQKAAFDYVSALGQQRGQDLTGKIAEGNLNLGYDDLGLKSTGQANDFYLRNRGIDVQQQTVDDVRRQIEIDAILRGLGLDIQRQSVEQGGKYNEGVLAGADADRAAKDRAAFLGAIATTLAGYNAGGR